MNAVEAGFESEDINTEAFTLAKVTSPLLIKLSNHLIKDGRPLQENCPMLLDCLLKSILFLTHQTKHALKIHDQAKFNWFPNLIAIRRLLNCLDSVLSKIRAEASSFKEALEEILRLESLKELAVRVPSSCERVRSLF